MSLTSYSVNKIKFHMFSTSKTSVKKVFLKNPRENTCAQVSETLAQVFSCAFCEFLRTHIYRAPPVAASES